MHTITLAGDGDHSPITMPRDRLLCLEEVKKIVGLGKTLIYRLVQGGQFPQPYKPGGSATRWSENELNEWMAACAAQRRH